jgi:hypothetical protein
MAGYSGLAGGAAAATVAALANGTMTTLKTSASMSRMLAVGVAIAATAIANVPGMGDASANWTAIAARLDAGVKLPLNDAIAQARTEWIAEDRQAFDSAVTAFQGDTEATRKFFEQIEKCLDDIGDAYRDYWFELALLSGALLTALLAAFAMLFTPLAPYGKALLEMLGALASTIIAFMTNKLGTFLALIAGTLITGAKGMVQLFNIKPSGSAAIDFTKAEVHWTAPTTWLEPKKAAPAPYGS